uniref:Uncharacterized protein n=1 Tax=Felis catus TaxID=9685 RepID=A0ABI7ZMZ4_FELCA
FIFAFVSLASGHVLSKILLWPRSKRFLPAFSWRILIISCLTFRDFIHFEFLFVYGVRKWSRSIFLHVAVQFSQHHLLKRLPLFHWIFFPALSQISWPYVLWVHFWVLYSIPLIRVSVLVSVPYCLDDYSFVIQLEVWDCDASSFGFLFQDCFGYSGSFLVPYKL